MIAATWTSGCRPRPAAASAAGAAGASKSQVEVNAAVGVRGGEHRRAAPEHAAQSGRDLRRVDGRAVARRHQRLHATGDHDLAARQPPRPIAGVEPAVPEHARRRRRIADVAREHRVGAHEQLAVGRDADRNPGDGHAHGAEAGAARGRDRRRAGRARSARRRRAGECPPPRTRRAASRAAARSPRRRRAPDRAPPSGAAGARTDARRTGAGRRWSPRWRAARPRSPATDASNRRPSAPARAPAIASSRNASSSSGGASKTVGRQARRSSASVDRPPP